MSSLQNRKENLQEISPAFLYYEQTKMIFICLLGGYFLQHYNTLLL